MAAQSGSALAAEPAADRPPSHDATRLLDLGATLVRPGGALVYVVCSLLDEEGAGQVDRFLAGHPGWTTETPIDQGRARGAGKRLTPAHDATDGFFVARLIRPC